MRGKLILLFVLVAHVSAFGQYFHRLEQRPGYSGLSEISGHGGLAMLDATEAGESYVMYGLALGLKLSNTWSLRGTGHRYGFQAFADVKYAIEPSSEDSDSGRSYLSAQLSLAPTIRIGRVGLLCGGYAAYGLQAEENLAPVDFGLRAGVEYLVDRIHVQLYYDKSLRNNTDDGRLQGLMLTVGYQLK